MEALVAALSRDALVSVDTYKPAVAEAAIAAGAAIVNDVSGLRDPALAELCARDGRGAGAHAHARWSRRGRCSTRRRTTDVVADVVDVPARADRRSRVAAGVDEEQLILDPGPGLRQDAGADGRGAAAAGALRALGRPIAARGLAQGLRRRDHRARARRSATRARWRRWRSASTRAPRSCACTTSRAPPTSSRCARSCAASACSGRSKGSRPSATRTGFPRTSR